ncbi:MAG: hypothetical protein JW820_07045 [Spirochaetales bacterium]|nr:hypothetical protein [Spirochaetales bacterium]
MKRLVLVCLLIAAASVLAQAVSHRLAVSDFVVHSNNPRFAFMGKGIAEMVAVELRKSPGVELVERENRVELLEEMEISLSEMADPQTQLRVGELLAAQFILFGELIDMDTEVLLSLRLTSVQSGKVEWNETLVETLSNYDYITGYFAASILRHLNLQVAQTTLDKMESKRQKDEQAVFALSRAIDAYDQQDEAAARQELARATRLDPASEAVRYYLSKLTVNTTKFTVMPEPYYSFQNPAYLGIIRTDTLNLGTGTHVYGIIFHDPIEYLNYVSFDGTKAISEFDFNVHTGYAFPLGERFGMRAEAAMYEKMDRYWEGVYGEDGSSSHRWGAGAILDLGFKATDSLALGLGVGIFSGSSGDRGPIEPFVNADKLVASANLGLLYRTPDESFVFDTRVGFCNETYQIIDPVTLSKDRETSVPIFLENTFTFAFNERRSFLNIKQLNDLCLDRVYYYGRLLPAVEHFFADWFAGRLGLEGSFAQLDESSKWGYGVLGGVTFRIVPWHCDLDMNLTYRMRPSRVVEELLYPDFIASFAVSFSDVFRSRE